MARCNHQLGQLVDADKLYRRAFDLTGDSDVKDRARIGFDCLFYIALVNKRLGKHDIVQQALGLFQEQQVKFKFTVSDEQEEFVAKNFKKKTSRSINSTRDSRTEVR